MPLDQPTPDRQGPGRLPGPDTASASAASAGSGSGSADRVSKRRLEKLEKSVSWSGLEWVRWLWYRLRFMHADIDYASGRMFELQAPWTADPQWHTRTDQAPSPGNADTASGSR
jgi:hypothetical protein